MELLEYQKEVIDKAIEKIKQNGIVYLSCETRTGKTSIALNLINMINPDAKIIFVTKKLIKQSAHKDYTEWGISNPINIISMDSLHKLTYESNVFFVIDESHLFGAYPKRSNRTTKLKELVKLNPVIYLSGTPSPESYSMIYHQLWISDYSPFKQFKNFYDWFRAYGEKKEKYIGVGQKVVDYSYIYPDRIKPILDKYTVSLSKKEAGFKYPEIQDVIEYVNLSWVITDALNDLMKDNVCEPDGFILKKQIIAETAGSLYSKHHQLCGGTIKYEDGTFELIDDAKVRHINTFYKDKKVAIFYNFVAEGEMLRQKLTKKIAKDSDQFNSTDHNTTILYQYKSGSMGIDLSSADCIIAYNIHPSASIYFQFRDRLQHYKRDKPPVCVFLFSNLGLEQKIYKALQKKKNFTLSYYKKGYCVRV